MAAPPGTEGTRLMGYEGEAESNVAFAALPAESLPQPAVKVAINIMAAHSDLEPALIMPTPATARVSLEIGQRCPGCDGQGGCVAILSDHPITGPRGAAPATPLSWARKPVDRKFCAPTFRWVCPCNLVRGVWCNARARMHKLLFRCAMTSAMRRGARRTRQKIVAARRQLPPVLCLDVF